MTDPKQQAVNLLRSIETGDRAAAAVINAVAYKQHNLAVADGVEGFAQFLHMLPKGSARARPVRAFRDGHFVFTHTEYDVFGPKVGFDIFRFEHGKIVEHWDNLQEIAAKPNPGGRSMVDGPTEATDLDQTEANKALAGAFIRDVLIGGQRNKLAGFFDGDRYLQHNPMVGDGLSGLGAALAEFARTGMALKIDTLHRVLGEGNFVLTVSEGSVGGKPAAFYDLFRIEAGKLAEHWDVIEVLPPKEQWKHGNGKF